MLPAFRPLGSLLRPPLVINRNLAGKVGIDLFWSLPGDLGNHGWMDLGLLKHRHDSGVPEGVAIQAVGIYPELPDNLFFYGESHGPELKAEKGLVFRIIFPNVLFESPHKTFSRQGKVPRLGVLRRKMVNSFGSILRSPTVRSTSSEILKGLRKAG